MAMAATADSSAKDVFAKDKSGDETRLLIQPDGDDSDGGLVASSVASDGSPQRVAPSRPTSMSSSTPTRKPKTSSSAADFAFIKIVARIAIQIVRKFWAFSSAAVLALILFYWLCGGVFAFFLVVFGVSGILYHAGDRLLYHPEQPPTSRVYVPSPSMAGLAFESIYIKSKDKTRLHMFLVRLIQIQAYLEKSHFFGN
jgi:hypothetical protein